MHNPSAILIGLHKAHLHPGNGNSNRLLMQGEFIITGGKQNDHKGKEAGNHEGICPHRG
jgi:hypothetical protein